MNLRMITTSIIITVTALGTCANGTNKPKSIKAYMPKIRYTQNEPAQHETEKQEVKKTRQQEKNEPARNNASGVLSTHIYANVNDTIFPVDLKRQLMYKRGDKGKRQLVTAENWRELFNQNGTSFQADVTLILHRRAGNNKIDDFYQTSDGQNQMSPRALYRKLQSIFSDSSADDFDDYDVHKKPEKQELEEPRSQMKGSGEITIEQDPYDIIFGLNQGLLLPADDSDFYK